MNLRAKLLLIFAALAAVPLIAVSVLSYRGGVRAVEGLLRARGEERAARIALRIERELAGQERRLLDLAAEPSVREYVRAAQAGANSLVPEEVSAHLAAFFKHSRNHAESLTCLRSPGRPLLRLSAGPGGGVKFQTQDFVTSSVRHDSRVWALAGAEALRSNVTQEPYGAALRATVPVLDEASVAGALVLETRLGGVLAEADGAEAQSEGGEARAAPAIPTNVIALDNSADRVVYHTNGALNYQPVAGALPYFGGVASRMREGAEGTAFYDEPDGDRWLAAYRQVRGLGLSLAVAQDYTAATAPARRSGLWGVALALLASLAALGLLLVIVRRASHGVARVARGAAAIAAGDLDQRIEVSASGETRELAESFNLMSDRLRELIAREAESRQFESFVRISAMLTHDLKNAIAGLSMLVTNMERQFHREEFRADAISSLREATEKLKRTVARLSEPVKSLSGEYRRDARPTDLVPLIRRVLAMNAEPSRPLYEIEARLPDSLVATVEPGRIENVVENLVINALEAMGARGGRLTVEAGEEGGGLVFIGVADTGVGMSEEFIRTRLFRPFSTTKDKGIGLGLFTCREIVEAHGGRLEVESQPGVGTRFRVVLPSRLSTSGDRARQPGKVTAAAKPDQPGA